MVMHRIANPSTGIRFPQKPPILKYKRHLRMSFFISVMIFVYHMIFMSYFYDQKNTTDIDFIPAMNYWGFPLTSSPPQTLKMFPAVRR